MDIQQVWNLKMIGLIDWDDLGTGTVLFSDSHSYMRAVAAGAIDIKCDCFHKLVSFNMIWFLII
jgi:hypothetical protein